jgi:proteasome lid subunit RPN8/RPN11
MNLTIKIPRSIFDRMIAQAQDERPRECCGLLGGRDSQAISCYPLQNKSPQPETRYFAAPEDLFAAMRSMRCGSEELIGIYHSHPNGSAYPSKTDLELAFYPQAVYLIIALDPQAEVRAFRIDGREAAEIEIDLIENAERRDDGTNGNNETDGAI